MKFSRPKGGIESMRQGIIFPSKRRRKSLAVVLSLFLSVFALLPPNAQAIPFLIRANDGISLTRLTIAIRSVGGDILETLVYDNLGFVGVVADLELRELRTLNTMNLSKSEPFIFYRSGQPAKGGQFNCQQLPSPWALDLVDGNSNGVYEAPPAAKPVHLYLLDSGVRGNHCEFQEAMNAGRVTVAEGTVPLLSDHAGNPASVDSLGHGTGVASCIFGDRLGVARGTVILHSSGVFGSEILAPSVTVLDAILHATDQHIARRNNDDPYDNASVINLSMVSDTKQASCQVEEELQSAIDEGIVVVTAAGNASDVVISGSDCQGAGIGNDPEEGYSPARLNNLITVGAIQQNGALWKVSKSHGTNTGKAVDFYAPGANISIAKNGNANTYRTAQSGTSYATAFAAGLAINVLSCNPLATPAQVRAVLLKASVPGNGNYRVVRQSPSSIPTIEASYQDWLDAYGFIPPTEADDSDDLPLLLEFFAGRNAKKNDGESVFWVEVDNGEIKFFYEKARYVGKTHTAFGIQQSSNLKNWSALNVPAILVSSDCFVETYRVSIPVNPGISKYFRLRVAKK